MEQHANPEARTHADKPGFVRKYVFSRNHKIIGLQYFFLSLTAALMGALLSALMRIHLVWPEAPLPFLGSLKPEDYLALMTMHGTLMVFFVLTTGPQSAFGNYFLPLQIGTREMAFPTVNLLSFWITFVSFVIMLAAFFVRGGASIAGWTQYVPLSAIPAAGPGQGFGTDLWLISIALFCVASAMTAVNFVATTLSLRAPGMTLMRMPLTAWAWFVTGTISIAAFGVLLAGAILLLMERHTGVSIFVPAGLMVNGQLVRHQGGSPLLWQHLFWFFGHPEVYIAILPGMGVTSHLLSTFARKPVFGYRAMVYAIIAIAALGFAIWGHHMFTTGMSPHEAFTFSSLTLAIGVPSAVKTFNWLATLWRGKIRLTIPMLFAIGFVSLFVTGGLTGPILAQPVLDSYLHDTYFVVAHFHMIMGMAAVFGIFAATYFWFPRMFGRMMSERLGRAHFWLTFIGAYATFMPMHFLGMAGHPRRYSQLTDVQFLHPMISLQRFITVAALITASAQLIFVINFFWSVWRGRTASNNPWEATTLEWQPTADTLQINHGPYEYSVPGAARDYVAQTDPPLPEVK